MTTQETNNHTPETSEDIYDFTKDWTSSGTTKQPKRWPINDDYQPCLQYMSLFDEIFISDFFVGVHRKDGAVDIYSPETVFTLNRGDCVYTGSMSESIDDSHSSFYIKALGVPETCPPPHKKPNNQQEEV